MIHFLADMVILLVSVNYHKQLSIAIFVIMAIKYLLIFQKGVFSFLYKMYKSDEDLKDLL